MGTWFSRHRHLYPSDWEAITQRVKERAGWCCEVCKEPHDLGRGYVLTTDHLDFNPSNVDDDNLAALCQRCHLKRQGMAVPPRTRGELFRRMKDQGEQGALGI